MWICHWMRTKAKKPFFTSPVNVFKCGGEYESAPLRAVDLIELEYTSKIFLLCFKNEYENNEDGYGKEWKEYDVFKKFGCFVFGWFFLFSWNLQREIFMFKKSLKSDNWTLSIVWFLASSHAKKTRWALAPCLCGEGPWNLQRKKALNRNAPVSVCRDSLNCV